MWIPADILSNQKEASDSKASSLQASEEQQKKLNGEIEKFKKEIASLKKQITTKNGEIEKLANNVKLLKKQ